MKKSRLVLVGNGMAGVRALEELLKMAPDLYEITVFGAEPHPNYNRILLSPVLAGEQTVDQIVLNPLSWYAENNITLHLGAKVVGIDRTRRIVTAQDGHGGTITAEYDRLLIATGSNPFSWPKEVQDDPQSRFVNERSHANIQKDGTYSVIPRMGGGQTTADELRRIADAVDKYKIPAVKVTNGQRIDLLGAKKEDLAGVWKDIGMPSGHAYAKALRTVKTCVGSEWCRFGTQDSTQMGKDLERALWRMYAPHKVKLAVSGCPRNCAEAGIKDVGVIGVDSGWEIYVVGNGGIKTEVAQFLCKLKTAEEVLEYSGAFLQLYREEGWYLERTLHYVKRVGLDVVKKKILGDHAGRKALWQRLQYSLDGEPDPWFEFDKARVDVRQFNALGTV